jgi:hypothetical protein
MDKNSKIAETQSEWWDMVSSDLSKWNMSVDPDDRLSLMDYIGELSDRPVYGWVISRDRHGDWEIDRLAD